MGELDRGSTHWVASPATVPWLAVTTIIILFFGLGALFMYAAYGNGQVDYTIASSFTALLGTAAAVPAQTGTPTGP